MNRRNLSAALSEKSAAVEKVELLQTATAEIGAAQDTHAATVAVLRQLCEQTGWDLGQVWILNRDGTALERDAVWSRDSDSRAQKFVSSSGQLSFPLGGGFLGSVWSTKQPKWIFDVRRDAVIVRSSQAKAAGLATALGIPVIAENEVIAVVELFTREFRPADKQVTELISGVAGQLGWTIRHKRAHEALLDGAELLKSHNRVLEGVARGEPLKDTLDSLLTVIESQCSGMLCSILLLDSDGLHVRHGSAPSLPESFVRGIDGEAIGPSAGSCGTAAFRREPVIVRDIATDPLWADYRDFALSHGLQACWSTPIFDGQRRVLGTFALYFRTPFTPTRRHQELIEMATSTASIAIIRHREMEALRVSEERMRLAISSGNVGVWEWNVVTDRLSLGEELKSVFDWVPDVTELTSKKFMQIVNPEDRDRVRAALEHALAEHTNIDVEFRYLRPSGSVHWIVAKGRGEYDSRGNPKRMIGVGLDTTERKRSEEAINRREALLVEAQRIAELGSYEWDVKRNKVYRSEELCRIFGVPAAEFEPTFAGYLDRVHPEDREKTRLTIEEALGHQKPFEFEERIVRPDGQIRLLHSQGRWAFDETGQPLKLVGICQDITDRRKAENQLRRSEERFQIVARATNDAIWDWNLHDDSVWWNRGVTSLFHYSTEEAVIRGWRREHIHPDDVGRVTAEIRGVMNAGQRFWSGEYRFRRADGTYADIFDRAFVIYDGDTPVRMIGAMADISERKRAVEILEQRVASRTSELKTKNVELEHEVEQRKSVEELLRNRNEELKGFAYTVSHDLKAPLRGIAGYAQELERRHSEGLSERALFCLKQILTATRNLDCLIEDLLHYSRLDAEAPTPTEFDLEKMIDAILRDRKKVIADGGTEIRIDLSATKIRTWERGLLQVLTNLIDNALKYSRNASPPRIHIGSRELASAVQIMVSDNGIGFDMKYHDRIFGLFNRLVRQDEFEGTGAGLAIVKKVVEKLGGRIHAESAPGAGATFFVELPDAGSHKDTE
jgi:PAS domain S-box-containing protein